MTDPRPPDGLRAADADREQVAQQLREAHAEGRLDLAELDERTAAAYAARTYGDLAGIIADLPASTAPVARRSPAPAARRAAKPPSPTDPNRGFRAAVGAWLVVSLINVVIWALVSVGNAEFVYPWWIWVAGPWGAVLLASWIGTRVSRS